MGWGEGREVGRTFKKSGLCEGACMCCGIPPIGMGDPKWCNGGSDAFFANSSS